MVEHRNKILIMTVIMVIILVGVIMVVIEMQSPSQQPPSDVQIVSTTNVTRPNLSTLPFASSNPVYVQAGYPKIDSNIIQYSPNKANYTVYLKTENLTYRIGELRTPVKSLDEAVRLAALAAGLDPEKYNLARANFSPGSIYNETMTHHPRWSLSFARVYQGFWIWGSLREFASVYAEVDAFNGNVTKIVRDEMHLPTTVERLEMKVSGEQAIETVRRFRDQDIPNVLLENGTVTRIEPRIVLLGPNSRNYALENPLDPLLSGTKRLYWMIELRSPEPQFGSFGLFLVDAETGEMAVASSDMSYPGMKVRSVKVAIDYLVVEGLTVSEEVFYLEGGIIGKEDRLPVIVPNVWTVAPGGSGTITLTLKSVFIDEDVRVSLSVLNPLPSFQSLGTDNTPKGVSIRFDEQQILVSNDREAEVKVYISAESDAPQKTYLLEIHATYFLGWEKPYRGLIRFFLTVWDGEGEWPESPTLK